MIIFGTRSKSIAGPRIEGEPCPHCQNQHFFTFGLMRYFHIYWIPMFLTSKNVGVECTHCKHTLIGKEVPASQAEQVRAQLFTTGKTLLMFSGLIILAGLAVVFALI